MLKTHTCNELSATHAGQKVTLAGWVNRWRDHGGLAFIDLRDRSGIVQVVANPNGSPDAHVTLQQVRSEYVLQVEGVVQIRPEGLANPDIPTGEIEVVAHEVKVLVLLDSSAQFEGLEVLLSAINQDQIEGAIPT